MTDKQVDALRLAKQLEADEWGDAAIELRRLHAENEALRAGEAFHKVAVQQRDAAWIENEALHKANEAFGKRQEWWNERMVQLEAENDALRKERDANLDSIAVGNEAITRLRSINAELAGALIDVMNRLVDRHETDEAAVVARAVLAEPQSGWDKWQEQKRGCSVCGIEANGETVGYVCTRNDCPTRVTCGGTQ